MKTAAIVFFAIILCVNALSDDEVHRQWQEFQQQFQKSYRSPVEAQKRYTIFKQHLEEMEALNNLYDEGKSTWKAGINQFSDMTDEEMKQYMGHGILLRAFTGEEQEIQRKWNEFQETFKKSYRSPVEAKKRFEIFKNNVIKMEEHNDLYEQGLVNDKQGINRFSDWTEEEFNEYVNKGLNSEEVRLGSSATEDEEIQRKWEEFQASFKKSYRSPVEAKKRFEIFKNNVIKMEEHNDLYEQGLVNDKQGINKFSDWTEEEFNEYVNKGLNSGEAHLGSSTTEDEEIQRKWEEFQATFKKSYRSPVEAKKRFQIFKNNVIKMEEHNNLYEQGLVNDKQGINKFSDWTEEEFEEYVNKGLNAGEVRVGSSATEDKEIQRKWEEFQTTFKKSYRSPVEARKRFEIFKKNVIKMEEHNNLYEQGLVNDKQGINKFSDWTEEEFKEYVNKGLNAGEVRVGSSATEDKEIQRKWEEFQATFKKSYRSPVEAKKRFEIFKNNVIKMEEHNDLYEQGLVNDKQGINKFSDWTEEEFNEYVNKGLNSGESRLGSSAIEDEEIQRKWEEFQATFKKAYRSPVEAKKRFEIFKNNVIKMEVHNDLYDQGLVGDKLEINQFSDWTEEEFKKYVNRGLKLKENLVDAIIADDEEIQNEWNEFQDTFKKSYRSPVEAKKRFEIFKNNVFKMEQHNDLYEKGLVSDRQGINQFSDWTEEEFKEYVNKGLNMKDTHIGSSATEDEEIKEKWEKFQATFQKSYRSPVEAKKRFEIFKNNVIKVEEHNNLYEQGLVSDKQGINQFSDWTDEEFKEYVKKGLKMKEASLGSSASADEEIREKWEEFQTTFKKSYRSPVEAKKRFEIFKNNVINMEEHNSLYEQGLVSDMQRINQFSDWTEEEFEKYVNKGLTYRVSFFEETEDDDMFRRWEEFQKKYGKTYKSTTEAKKRFEIFKENVEKIDEHNALYDQGKTTFTMDINEFADWTHDEYIEWLKSH